jgi:hypothetical protein
MKPMKGYYSIVQYCPDLSRFEAANVGVLVFCPERRFLKALTVGNNSRIIRFFGSEGHDWERINTLKHGLEDRLQNEATDINTVDDLKRFIALRAGLLQITPPKPMRVADPDKDLVELYEQVIGEPIRTRRGKSLKRYIGEKLHNAGLDKKIARDLKITVPVLQKVVEFPFGFQNGRFNLINPVSFRAANPDQSVATACKYAVQGRSLYQEAHPKLGKLQLVIVGQFRPKDKESPQKVNRVFQEYNVALYRTDEISKLADEIRRTGIELCTLGDAT